MFGSVLTCVWPGLGSLSTFFSCLHFSFIDRWFVGVGGVCDGDCGAVGIGEWNGTDGVFCSIRHGLWTDDTLSLSLSFSFLSLLELDLAPALHFGMDDEFGECQLNTHLASHALVAGWPASFGRLASDLLVCGASCI